MKLQEPEKKDPPFDVPPGLAEALLAQGYVKIEPVVKAAVPNAQWAARQGVREADYQFPPYLVYSCSTCGNRQTTESKRGTAHLSAELRHCGVVDRCPEDVAAKYLELFNEWKSRTCGSTLARCCCSRARRHG